MRPQQIFISLTVLTSSILCAMAMNNMTGYEKVNTTVSSSIPAGSYFRESIASNLLYSHIGLMSLAWVCVLPICVVLDLAGSNLWYPSQILFHGLNGIGVIFGLAYNSKTPDLYKNNSHRKLGWTLTFIVLLGFALRVLRSVFRPRKRNLRSTSQERTPFIPLSTITEESPEGPNQLRHSYEDGSSSDETDSSTLFDGGLSTAPVVNSRYNQPMTSAKRWKNIMGASSIAKSSSFLSSIFNFVLVILGFVAVCTGLVTMAGIFHEKHIFNGLAHFIKGGVFFWYGIITLTRWIGCFAELGWAWNLKTSSELQPGKLRISMTMEAMECLLILVYGITNVFLEHLSAWGEAWVPQDFEHVAISLLFIGGGMCGMMVESKSLAGFLARQPVENSPGLQKSQRATLQPGFSINPVPPMVIFLLGLILGGHHQNSMESTMMHKFFGSILTAASASRFVTYLIFYISPPTSSMPSRPPSEVVCSFCLMSGGLLLMASNRDTVDAMIENGLNTMLVATVIMGLTAMMMSWCIFVIGVKHWAEKREELYMKVKIEGD